ncbi:hypothetical protein RGQ29_021339 [Quercus rubra]|uniref:Retrovirus-related Pol polyprotein from transposon TNT 1-94 n=1 Tax=Quercus rubra TaxID=3512 RepID=A0AAN7FDF0_QUERU|nr:hypothetical protein RGQ29_021339 [Quercus rubra]
MTQLIRYLKRTAHYGLLYQRYPAVLEGYSDASWNTLSGGGAISWKSKKQQIIAKSTMEAELIALSSASEEAGWLRDLLSEIPIWEKPISPVLIHCDSIATIGRVHNKYYNGKSRSIRRKHSTVRSYINNGTINVDYISTNDNIADPLTKALVREKIWIASRGMGLKPKEE